METRSKKRKRLEEQLSEEKLREWQERLEAKEESLKDTVVFVNELFETMVRSRTDLEEKEARLEQREERLRQSEEANTRMRAAITAETHRIEQERTRITRAAIQIGRDSGARYPIPRPVFRTNTETSTIDSGLDVYSRF